MQTVSTDISYSVKKFLLPESEKKRIVKSIASYRAAGIDIEILDDVTIKITQARLINGYILSNRQLYERAKEVFGIYKMNILPVVYSLGLEDVNIKWVKEKMEEFGIHRNDLIKQLGLDKSTLSLYFSEARGLTNTAKAAFFYYFLTYELNRDLRAQL